MSTKDCGTEELSWLTIKMVKTIDKIVIGILAVLLVGMGGVFITAISSDTNEDIVSSNRQLLVTDVTPKEANFVVESNLEEDEDD